MAQNQKEGKKEREGWREEEKRERSELQSKVLLDFVL